MIRKIHIIHDIRYAIIFAGLVLQALQQLQVCARVLNACMRRKTNLKSQTFLLHTRGCKISFAMDNMKSYISYLILLNNYCDLHFELVQNTEFAPNN